jgi:hypothetical protein
LENYAHHYISPYIRFWYAYIHTKTEEKDNWPQGLYSLVEKSNICSSYTIQLAQERKDSVEWGRELLAGKLHIQRYKVSESLGHLK